MRTSILYGYTIQEDGKVFRGKKEMRPYENANRQGLIYMRIKLTVNGERRAYYLHRLVMQAFSSWEEIRDFHVDHVDGDTTNNALDNLMIMSRADNNRKRVIITYSKHAKHVNFV